ncbi:ketopantoate reductase family protein [Tepidibacter sp. Z1-5]|uniref:ketopantoate reductase family protein n=1 Tax=Tepidibacter sp. Z1-5 TaxID=3134138 RepID=UPI0030C5881C
MRTAMFGCGAMGTVMGAILNREGVKMDMIDIYEDHVNEMNAKGAKLIGSENFTQPVNALLPSQMEGIYDLIILLTKQTANQQAFEQISKHVDENSTILTLQNGFPEPYVANFFGEERTVGGTLLWGATFIEPGVSEVTEPLEKKEILFEIGRINGKVDDRVKMIAEILEKMGTTVITTELEKSRWNKVLYNSCMSGMSAALCCEFGRILDNEKGMKQIGRLAEEVVNVCKASGASFEDFLEEIIASSEGDLQTRMIKFFSQGYANMRPAKASMLQDLEKNKMTEVEYINGYVTLMGRKHNVATPTHDLIVKMVHEHEKEDGMLSFEENLSRFED